MLELETHATTAADTLTPASATATYAVQDHAAGSAAWVLCGLLLSLQHQLATCNSKKKTERESTGAAQQQHSTPTAADAGGGLLVVDALCRRLATQPTADVWT